MNDEYKAFVKGKVIPNYLIEDIIYDFDNTPGFSSGVMTDGKDTYDKSVRSSISKIIDPKTYPDLNGILTGFCSILHQRHIPSLLVLGEMEHLKYGISDHFLPHDDVIPNKNPKRIRRFSTVTLLSKTEDLEGGQLIIYDKYGNELDSKLEVGETILFYSSTLHEVTPVTKGGREVLVGWIYDL
jgi:hypothetical protein